MRAHGLFCANMWELRALKMALPQTMEALRLMWSAYMELKRKPAQLTWYTNKTCLAQMKSETLPQRLHTF